MKALAVGRRVAAVALLALSAVIASANLPQLWQQPLPHGAIGPATAAAVAPGRAPDSQARGLTAADAQTAARVNERYGQLPLRFEANQGQFERAVKFVARDSGYTLALTGNEAVLQLRTAESAAARRRERARGNESAGQTAAQVATLKMKLKGAQSAPRSVGLDQLATRSNYFLGREASAWRVGVANFARVKYEAVYPGIDLVWYGNQQQLEHDFIVAPGADPRRIQWEFTGAHSVARDQQGDLVLKTEGGELRLLKPVAWQEQDGERRLIGCEYLVRDDGRVGFELGQYDRSQTLVIDPILLYSTFIGGTSSENARSIVVDKDGNAYVVGDTNSMNFPVAGPIQPQLGSNFSLDAFVLKLNPSGSALVYATYLGGSSTDLAFAAALDAETNLYVTGYTGSTNFPTTANALQKESRGNLDAFVAKINPTGSALIYASYLGGNGLDIATSIAVNAAGEGFLSGYTDSTDLPANGVQKTRSGQVLYKSDDRGGQWRGSDNGLAARIVNRFAFDPSDTRTLYAATNTGIFKSTDSGGTWQKTGFLLPTQAVAVDPQNPLTLYAASEFGFYKSIDGGATWQEKRNGLVGFSFYSLLIDPQTPATVYVGSTNGVFKSVNGGENWMPAFAGLGQPGQPPQQPPSNRVDHLVADPVNPMIIYAGTSLGVFKTLNGGGQWFAANTGLGTFPGTIRALVADPLTPGTLYVSTSIFSTSVFKSVDGGNSWTPSATGLVRRSGTVEVPLTVTALAIDPVTPATLYAGTQLEGVFKSTDGGANWSQSNNGMKNFFVRALAVDRANPAMVYAGMQGGTDGFVAKLNAAGTSLGYLTYLGGAEADLCLGLALDKDSNVFVTGETASPDFPVANALQATRNGLVSDAFVTKLDPTGATLLYSTYLGGSNIDFAEKIAVDAAGSVYLTGTTQSSNFPTRNAAQATFGGFNSDAFVTKLNPAGAAIEYSTYLGGQASDVGRAIAVDAAGNAYVAGATQSSDFPSEDPLPQQPPTFDINAFVVKLAAGGAISYATLLGGSTTDQAYAIAVDAGGNAYVAGATGSRDFPTIEPIQQLAGGLDIFVAKLGFEADVALTMAASRNPVMVGNPLRYTLTATNNGPSAATGIVVTDTLPGNVTFVSATASQGTCNHNAGTVTCNLGRLAAQASATITLTVTPTGAGALANTARVQANEPDKFPNNNQATAQTMVANLPSIAGRVADANGQGLSGVTVRLAGGQTAMQQTDEMGFYQFAGLTLGGNYTITPTHSLYSFEPASIGFDNLSADQNADFRATTCSYAITPNAQSFEMSGGAGTITVTATPRCAWTATSNADWVRITAGGSGAGNGEVSFTVQPATSPRSAQLTVAGQTFTVYQASGVCATPSLRTASYYLGPTSAQGFDPQIVATDFNGDGRTDLVVLDVLVNSGSDRGLRVLTGTPQGGFDTAVALRVPGVVQAFDVADFNGDGRPDVVDINLGNVEIRLNDGAGGLRAPVAYPFNPSQTAVAGISAVDFNRDGKSDLAIYSSRTDSFTTATLRILLNNGSGGLLPPLTVALGNQTVLGITDVNADGNPDLLGWIETFSNGVGTQTLRLYPGDGRGSVGPPVESRVNFAPDQAAFGDFNGDGKLDAVFSLSTTGASRLVLLAGDGRGGFGAPFDVELPEEARGAEERLLPVDLNNDAKLDLVLAVEGRLFFFPGDGAGKLGAGVRLLENLAVNALLAADLNGDGRLDLAGVVGNATAGNTVYTTINRCGVAPVIYGKVTDGASPLGLSGVTVKLSGPSGVTQTVTDSGGNYRFAGLTPGASYTVTPERPSIKFTPESRTINNLTADEAANFAATRTALVVSAASFRGDAVAPESIAAVSGEAMTIGTAAAAALPLPLQLSGVSVRIRDAAGIERPARLFFVSPRQINLLMPPELAAGLAQLTITQTNSTPFPAVTTATVRIENVAPGLFAADGSGRGLAAGFVVRVRPDASQLIEPIARFDAAQQRFVAVPIDVSNPQEQVFLALLGTGVRNRSSLAAVTARLGGSDVPALFAGPVAELFGVDQINLRLSPMLAGRGDLEVLITADGKTSNAVVINVR